MKKHYLVTCQNKLTQVCKHAWFEGEMRPNCTEIREEFQRKYPRRDRAINYKHWIFVSITEFETEQKKIDFLK
jgi:hypothetical protein